MDARDLYRALLLAEDMSSPADDDIKDRRGVFFAFLRIQQSQIHDLVDYSYVERELAISLDVLARARIKGVDLDRLFETAYGTTYRRLAVGCLALWGRVTADGQEGFYLPPGQTGDLGIGLEPEKLITFISATRNEFLREQQRLLVPEFETYSLSGLKTFPILELSDGDRSAPVTNDLLDRPIRPFFYDFIHRLGPKDEGVFREALGDAYSDYVLRSLSMLPGMGTVERAEDILQPASGDKICDYVYVEPGCLTFIEAKSARLLMRADVTKAEEELRARRQPRRCCRAGGQLGSSGKRGARLDREAAADDRACGYPG